MDNKTVILIPTLNEAEAIGQTIDDVLEHVPGCLVLVINGPSTDRTADIARDRGATVIDAPKGKGLAIRTVLPDILDQYPGEYYVMLDGDYTYPAKHIPSILRELKEVGTVIGYRAIREHGSMTATNKVGNWGLSMLASTLYKTWVQDVCSGLWGFRRDALREFTLTSDSFTLEVDLFANAVRNGYGLAQIPIEYRARIGGSVPKLKVSDGFEIAWFLLKARFVG